MIGARLRSGKISEYTATGAEGFPTYSKADQLLSIIRRRLGQEIAGIFAVARINDTGDEIEWYAPNVGRSVPWSTATEEEKAQARRILTKARDKILEYSAEQEKSSDPQHKLLGKLLENSVHIPDEAHIYIVNERPVLTFWSFDEGSSDVSMDVLSELLSLPEGPEITSRCLKKGGQKSKNERSEDIIKTSKDNAGFDLDFPFEESSSEGNNRASNQGQGGGGSPITINAEKSFFYKYAVPATCIAVPLSAALYLFFAPAKMLPNALKAPNVKRMVVQEKSIVPKGSVQKTSNQVSNQKITKEDALDFLRDRAKDAIEDAAQDSSEESTELLPSEEEKEEKNETKASEQELNIPLDSLESLSVDFFNGRWSSSAGLIDSETNEAINIEYDVQGGNGTARVKRSNGSVCSGNVVALIEGNELIIDGKNSITCSDGISYNASKVVCSKTNNSLTSCRGFNSKGGSYPVRLYKSD